MNIREPTISTAGFVEAILNVPSPRPCDDVVKLRHEDCVIISMIDRGLDDSEIAARTEAPLNRVASLRRGWS